MTLSDLAALGSFVSGIAVLVSLIYLSLQIRQNTLAHRATAHKVRADFVMESLHQLGDPVLASTFVRGAAGDRTLSEAEFTQFNAYMHAWFVGMSEIHWLHQRGMLDEDAFQGSIAALRARLQSPGIRAEWSVVRPVMPEHFRVEVDRLMAEQAPAPPANRPFEQWKTALSARPAGS